MAKFNGKKVLAVGSDQALVSLLVQLLEFEGFEAEAAFGTQAALKISNGYTPDVVVLDIVLPTAQSYADANALHRRFGDAVPIVGVSGLIPEGSRGHATGVIAAWVEKPFEVQDLVAAVRGCSGVRAA